MNNLWPARHIARRVGDRHVLLISFIFFISLETGTVPALE
jgi:hypothetical protein